MSIQKIPSILINTSLTGTIGGIPVGNSEGKLDSSWVNIPSPDLSGYALANHTHSEYATQTDINNRFGIAVEKVNTLTSSSEVTIDPTQGSIFTLTLDTNANISLSSISNGYYTTNGSCVTLMMPSNSYTVSWSSNITWISGSAPDLSTGYNIITFITPNGGTTWYGDALQVES